MKIKPPVLFFLTTFVLCLFSQEANAQSTGTSRYGYKLTAGKTLYNFVDISQGNVGATLPDLNADDASSEELAIGFPFRFFENEYSSCFINTNGTISFETGDTSIAPTASTFNPAAPNNVIGCFHVDLNPSTLNGEIYFATIGNAPNRRFIIQWDQVSYFGATGRENTFQIQLYEATHAIEFHYKLLTLDDGPSPFAIYLENKTGTDAYFYTRGVSNDLGHPFAIPFFEQPFETFGLRFERPVSVTVESALVVGTPLSALASKPIGVGKVTPYGTTTREPDSTPRAIGSEVTFEAPEFIYFNAAGVELDEIGGLGGTLASITVGSGGAYASTPTVTITGGGGVGATATAVLSPSVSVFAVAVLGGGSGYTSPPTMTFSGGGGSGAAATAVVEGGVVTGVTITNGGTGYTSAPTVGFVGGGGSGASGNVFIGKSVASVTIDQPGTGYTSTPNVTFTAGGGSGAEAIAIVNSDQEDNIAYYRARNVGYAIVGQDIQGTEFFFEEVLREDITVIWKWELEYAVFIESETSTGVTLPDPGTGVGNPLPVVGRIWLPKDSEFSASVDRTVGNDTLGLDISGRRFYAASYQLEDAAAIRPTISLGETGNRVVTETVTINNWLRLKWQWKGQVRYRFDAAADASLGSALFAGKSFLRVYNEGESAFETITGFAPFNEHWIDLGRKVEVGAFYRTVDNCYTLGDFVSAPSGNLGSVGFDIAAFSDMTIPDPLAGGVSRTARVWTIGAAVAPTEAHFVYQPTVFRAEIPLGGSLNAANPALVPPLCTGGQLRRSQVGPADEFIPVGVAQPDGDSNGFPVRWDQVSKRLFPVHPGSYQIQWPDANDPGTVYQIEIVTGYPGTPVPLASERELVNGMREIDDNNYVFSTDLASIALDKGFPAAPAAHYRHIYDSAQNRTPPTRLDLDPEDHWNFEELTYSDNSAGATADDSTAGAPFAASGDGKSVVLFSYRPNQGEIANGTPSKEKLAVFVVQSEALATITPDDESLILGRRGLELGHEELGMIQSSPAGLGMINPGKDFVIDFWLNSKGVKADDDAITLLSTGNDALRVVLDPDPTIATITTSYLGMNVAHPFSTAGPTWRHCVIHAFEDSFFGAGVTIVNFHLDGERVEQGTVVPNGAPSSTVSETVTPASLRLGIDANPASRIQIDQLRMFALPDFSELGGVEPWLTASELQDLRTDQAAELRARTPLLRFDFETRPGVDPFANGIAATGGKLGPVSDDSLTRIRLDIQEVATRLDSTLDNAGFGGSGYILNGISNYNANLYNRTAEVGTWGPVFPVNHGQLYQSAARRLEVAYYENPFLVNPTVHANVAWPYEAMAYDEVIYPAFGPHKDKAIYLASRVGSEGVDVKGQPQPVYDLEEFSDFAIYNQPDTALPGYNPNEEHALAAASNRAGLKIKNLGEDIPNNPPLAAFALQNDVNATSPSYSSEPWVLVQASNLLTGEPEMAAYQVFKTRTGTIPFPRPDDAVVNATDGLAYEEAPLVEDRFLTIKAAENYPFSYQFNYPAFAGDLLIPPYPLNLVIGNVSMPDARGGNVQVNGVSQRTLWRDVNHNAWVVSGGGQFFHQFFYPFRGDFHLPGSVAAGTPVAWLPETNTQFLGDNLAGDTTADDSPKPVKVTYSSLWRSDYPKLKRGETLTYQGGEAFNESPGANGLPALVAMAAAEVIYDSATPDMVITDSNVDGYSARIIRPLDRREAFFTVSQMGAAEFTPAASEKVFLVAERWYFKELPGSLQKRFYFDSLAEKLVFRGFLNDKDSGDPDLTSGPDPINSLEPNVMTRDEFVRVRNLSGSADWISAVTGIYRESLKPNRLRRFAGSAVTEPLTGTRYFNGVRETPAVTLTDPDLTDTAQELLEKQRDIVREIDRPWVPSINPSGAIDYTPVSSPVEGHYLHLNSFGVGSALVPSPALLRRGVEGSLYVTIAENNRGELDGAPVGLHIIEIVPDRYRGAIKVIEPSDAFSEKISLQHNGEFGANTGDLYYEWWIRDAASLDTVAAEVLEDGTLKEFDSSGNSLWQQYIPQERLALTDENARHLGLHSIVFEGRPDVTLADKLVLMRYRHKDESGWNLVPFEVSDAVAAWQPTSPAPFQWAGAANSPQPQADGSKRYIPQLVMGWVKRILDRINPYEARYTDFFSNESPATYSSQIQIAGAPYSGKVALNSDKNVIENTGLIELYRTVLERARELSIDNSSNPVSTDGINQALLLAATRLSVLYELLAREAYSDAQDSTIRVTNEDGLAGVASFTHAFQNMEADLMNEELALLRGTDFVKSQPVVNRIFWNYAKGLGEAAYNVNYNIYDETGDGFINEDDARALYPQGHGDAWGHYTSAIGMHYELLRQPVFNWRSRSELYSLMQNVLEVDFLDEKTFAKLAAGKARAGRDIVRGTYRLKYTQDPDGQWQGYTDSADPARAWGVSEWAHRSAQGAYFDWAVANALLPENADQNPETPVGDPENLDLIERSAAESEIGEIVGALYEIQTAMDEANIGSNPLGFDSDAIAFDLDPTFVQVASAIQGKTHFEQIYDRALTAGTNALSTLDFAAKTENKLRRIADDTDSLFEEALRQDLDYRNRLIDIFGRPYDGTIGFGKLYDEGYDGPDVFLYSYLDRISVDQIIPDGASSSTQTHNIEFTDVMNTVTGLSSNRDLRALYRRAGIPQGTLTTAVRTFIAGNNYQDPTVNFSMPVRRASAYAFQSIPDWGKRTSYGRTQRALEDMLRDEIALKGAVDDYQGFLQDFETLTVRLMNQIELVAESEEIATELAAARKSANDAIRKAQFAAAAARIIASAVGETAEAVAEAFPTSLGFSNDVTSPGRGAILGVAALANYATVSAGAVEAETVMLKEIARDRIIAKLERKGDRLGQIAEIEGILVEIEQLTGNDGPMRAGIGVHLQNLETHRQHYVTALSEGFRLLREREAFNKILAAEVQQNRYQDMVFRLS